jgi:hypothetical protein
MCCVLHGNKRGSDFNELIYGPRSHWSDDLEILLSLDSDDLPCHYAPDPLCQCGVQLDREWNPPSLAMASFVVTLLVRMMHG